MARAPGRPQIPHLLVLDPCPSSNHTSSPNPFTPHSPGTRPPLKPDKEVPHAICANSKAGMPRLLSNSLLLLSISFCLSLLTLSPPLCLCLPLVCSLSRCSLKLTSTYEFLRGQDLRDTHGKGSSPLASAFLLSHLQWVIYYRNTLRSRPADSKLRYYVKVPAPG